MLPRDEKELEKRRAMVEQQLKLEEERGGRSSRLGVWLVVFFVIITIVCYVALIMLVF